MGHHFNCLADMNTEKVIKIGQSQVINLPRGFHLYKFETTIIVIPKRQ